MIFQRRVLLVVAWYPNSSDPTAATFVRDQARMLYNHGLRVTVVHTYLKGTFRETLFNRQNDVSLIEEDGIKVIRVGVSPPLPGMRSIAYQKLCRVTCSFLEKVLPTTERPDVIHSHSIFMGGVVGMYLSRKWKKPQVHTEHTSGLIFDPKQYTTNDIKVLQDVYRHASNLLLVSNWFRDEMTRKYHLSLENLEVLPNVVAPDFFSSTIRSNNTCKKVLTIGNFIPVKQHELLLKAWSLVHEQRPDLTLTLAGEGPLKDELIQLSKELSIQDSIHWLPRQDRKGILKLMQEHDLIVSCSKVETFGLTVAEATACGKPVVVTDSGGVRDIVTKTNGSITKQNPDSLAQGIIQLVENFAKYDPLLISEEVKARFSSETISEQLEDIYMHTMLPKRNI
jgi:glycosyltransferase involved in cell wall biosynthesis